MNINALNVTISNQTITMEQIAPIVEHTQHIYTATFSFDENWDGFAKTVIFTTGEEHGVFILDETLSCPIPEEVIVAGRMYVGVYGVNAIGQIMTTKRGGYAKIYDNGGDITVVPEVFTPSQFDLLMAKLAEVSGDISTAEETIRQALTTITADLTEIRNAKQDIEADKTEVANNTTAVRSMKTSVENTALLVASDKTAAEQAKTQAQTSASNAQASATQSGQSASNALASENSARQSANSAAQSLADVNNAKAGAMSEIDSARLGAIRDISNAEDTAADDFAEVVTGGINRFNIIKNSAIETMEQARNEAQDLLDSIPPDYTETVEDVGQIKEDLSGLTGRVTTVESAIPPLQKQMADHQRELEALWLLNEGQTYREETVSATAMENTVSTGARFGEVLEYGGKSVVWNQILPNRTNSQFVSNGITFTNNFNGTWEATGTSTAVGQSVFSSEFNLMSNHKYYIGGINGSESTVRLRFLSGSNTYIYVSTPILHNPITDYTLTCSFYFLGGVTLNGFKLSPNVIDLTQLFGAGNEPTSVDDPRIKWIEQYVEEHPEYNEGEVIHAMVDDVEERGVNLIDAEEIYKGSAYMWNDGILSATNASIHNITIKATEEMIGKQCTFSVVTQSDNPSVSRLQLMSVVNGVTAESPTQSTATDFTKQKLQFTPQSTNDYVRVSYGSSGTSVCRYKDFMICIGDYNYEPYREASHQPIPTAIQQLHGYGWGISDTVRNYVDCENKQYVQMVNRVIMSTSISSYSQWGKSKCFSIYLSNSFDNNDGNRVGNCVVSGYDIVTANVLYNSTEDKIICQNGKHYRFIDNAYTSIESYSSAHQNEYLYYRLAEPIITPLTDDMLLDAFITETGGTVTFHNDNLLDVPNKVKYAVKLSEVVSV